GSFFVRMLTSSPSRSGKARSRTAPFTFAATAALASPEPICAAKSAADAPSSRARALPSGSFTWIIGVPSAQSPCAVVFEPFSRTDTARPAGPTLDPPPSGRVISRPAGPHGSVELGRSRLDGYRPPRSKTYHAGGPRKTVPSPLL